MHQILNTTLLKYPNQVPRYTSYPTAPQFTQISTDIHKHWLTNIPASSSLSLYLHIPYCTKLCWFCGCNTNVAHCYEPISTYLDALEKEIQIISEILNHKPIVSHIHLGGGSPTILSSHDFSRIFDRIRSCFNIQSTAEIAIEIDPRTVSESKIASYARNGVNRASIGIQDFNSEVQIAINRIQPFDRVYESVELLRSYGINKLSFDLIYGLPKQSLESFSQTIEYALLLKPKRFALFGYAHVPWKKKNMRLIKDSDLPCEAQRLHIFANASRQLTDAGYTPIGLDHFVTADDPMAIALQSHTLRRNFQGYTTDQGDVLIGLGASAISSFTQGYLQNISSVKDYENALFNGTMASSLGYELTKEDQLRRHIIEELMCYYEVDLEPICDKYLLPLSTLDLAIEKMASMERDQLVRISGNKIYVNREFSQAVRLVCTAFDAYFSPGNSQHGKVA